MSAEVALLAGRFAALWQRNRIPGTADHGSVAWQEIERSYAAPDRHYHSLRHLAQCLAEFDAAGAATAEGWAVELALWFHDLVLEPGARDNEQRSSERFALLASGQLAPARIERVSGLVLATTHRAAPADAAAQLVCDIDLSSLGAAWPEFLADSRALWDESRSDWQGYAHGKIGFYTQLCARPRIFMTEHFHARCEQDARSNMERLGAMLRAGERL